MYCWRHLAAVALAMISLLLLSGLTAAQGQTRFTCGFEENEGLCTFIQDKADDPKNPNSPNPDLTAPGASFDWERRCDPTPTVGTGPNSGAEGSQCFAYIETSDPQNPGDEARMTTPPMNFIGQMCVDFFYHMRGVEIGTLIVYLQTGAEYTSATVGRGVFLESGEKTDEWLQARFSVQLTNNMDRIGFLGRKGNGYRGDIALDNVLITTGNCDGTFQPVTLPYTCSFETETLCNYVNSNLDTFMFDWTRESGPTPTENTGPTSAVDGIYYMFIETSDPRVQGDFAVLESPPINQSSAACIQLSYHMYGAHIASLQVFTTSRGQSNPWWSVQGDQGNLWRLARVDVTLQTGDRVGFLGSRGADIQGDISIDMVEIFSGPCQEDPEVPTPSPPPAGTSDLPFLCTFETDICGMFQRSTGTAANQDEFDWTRHTGPTDSEGTGPSAAGFGLWYIYTEASSPRRQNDEAVVETPGLRYTGEICVRFWYHMYDSTNTNMGRLRVYRSMTGATLFDVSGNQGNQWLQANIDTQIVSSERIVFSGTVGTDVQGDISLDNIEIQQGRCTQTPAPTPSPPGTGEITLPIYSCDGEGDGSAQSLCRLRQDTADNMQWIMNTGRTASGRLGDRRINGVNYPVTGPNAAYQGTRYMYIEASGRPQDDMARLLLEGSSLVTSGNACLRFAYNMNGYHIGSLQVFAVESGTRRIKWRLQGDQGQSWLLAAVDLRMDGVSQVGFEAFTNGEFSGDIALDSFQLSTGTCYTVPVGYIWSCDFETSDGASAFCNMEQSLGDTTGYDWNLWTGPTPSDGTGPPFAYNGQYYIFMEASNPHSTGDSTSVLLPTLNINGPVCVEFRYYMYGHHIGRLEVFRRQGGFDGQQIFTIAGEKEQTWRMGRVGINSLTTTDQIGFRGVRGTEFSGDIALDNIRVRTGTCTSTESA